MADRNQDHGLNRDHGPNQDHTTPRAPLAPLHDEPFAELQGGASQVVVSADGQWIAVSSVVYGMSRVAVHRAADLSCAHLMTFTMDADSIAFHPTLPLLAIGLDNGDEYDRAGCLTLFEPGTGHRVDFADPKWGIDPIRWLDARTLELTFFSVDPDDEYVHYSSRATVVRDDWLGLSPEAVDLTALDRWPVDPDDPDTYPDLPGRPARPLLTEIAERAGRSYTGHGRVRDMAGLSDGRVLATRHFTTVECWAPDGSLLWRVPSPSTDGGARIEVAADERTVRVAVSGPDARARTDFPLVATDDGTVLDRPSVPFSAALSARTDGVWAIRDTYNRSIEVEPPTPPNTRFFAADGTPLGGVQEPNRYDLVPLDVRRCPELLYGRRRRDVIALDPRTTAETTLFSVDAPLGRAVYTTDAAGAALLHGTKELVRRAFPTGEVVWTRPVDAEVLALDAYDGVLHALCADNTLVSADTATGTVLGRRELPPYGPLSLHVTPDGTVLVGTAAGQILRY
ncbi:PQQ-binding-like beta-propeller repeat protein [Streptomyces sp. NPDC050848]|uniref:outer membrane protein assembly factor BamB family protein n=1 Tax=Streptomyces sp. NPDC050848 TaxID=3155791 RepID=UPI00340B454A